MKSLQNGLTRNLVVVLAAGGTGGHIFPAQALTEEIIRRGGEAHLVTDLRGVRYVVASAFTSLHVISSATFSFRKPLSFVLGIFKILRGIFSSLLLFIRQKPDVIVGFGGYPSVPPIIAALILRIPLCLHEQNAVIGRANRLFASRARVLAVAFPKTEGICESVADKVVFTGNPVRSSVILASSMGYEPSVNKDKFHLLVFGGSQGAQIFSEIIPAALLRLDLATRLRLRLVQQVDEHDLEHIKSLYLNMGVDAELAPFFTDMAVRLADSHLVIARSGATTVAELIVLGRPSILVPLPSTLDGDQQMNASFLEATGAAWVVKQHDFTPERLANDLQRLMQNEHELSYAASAMRSVRYPDAARRLADLVTGLKAGIL